MVTSVRWRSPKQPVRSRTTLVCRLDWQLLVSHHACVGIRISVMEPRRRRLGRPGVQRLASPVPMAGDGFDSVAGWRAIRPPRTVDGAKAGRAEYAAKWRALCWA